MTVLTVVKTVMTLVSFLRIKELKVIMQKINKKKNSVKNKRKRRVKEMMKTW